MSLEDPFLIVQNEVFDSLHKLRNNFARWTELQTSQDELSRDDYSSFVTELKNGLKSIQWDLDELEESLNNSERLTTLDASEIQKRKTFIDETREEIRLMNEKLSKGNTKFKKIDYNINFGSQPLQAGTKYYRLINEPDTNTNVSKHSDEDEHKSPYVPNHSIIIDEAEPSNIVFNTRPNKFQELKQFWSSVSAKNQKIIYVVTAATLLVLLILLFKL